MEQPDDGSRSAEQTTILGIGVHLFGLFYSVVGAGIVYLLTSDEFTKENARNALNWHIFFLVVAVVIGGLTVVLGAVADVLGLLLILGVILLIALDTAFCIWATYKAVDGTVWTYPIAPEFI